MWKIGFMKMSRADFAYMAVSGHPALTAFALPCAADVGAQREHAYMDVGSRAMQEQLPRSESVQSAWALRIRKVMRKW